MKHCNHCKIDVATSENYCPLCYNYLEKSNDTENFNLYLGHETLKNRKSTSNFLKKLFIFISICISVICVVINYFTGKNFNWSLVVVASLFYAWVLVAHTIISSRNMFEKIFFQLMSLLLILWSLTNIAMGNWLFNYVLPSIMLAATTAMAMISLIAKNRQNYLVSFFMFYIIFIIVSLVFLLFVRNVYHLLNFINIVYTGLILVGTLIFSYKTIKAEISKKAHL